MIQLIAFDLDETLLSNDKTISKGNKEALKRAKDKGIKLVPCSGRGPCMLQDIYDGLDIFEEGQYSILCNGGYICDNYTNKTISCHPIPKDMISPLIHFGLEKGMNIQIFTPNHLYCYNTDEEERNVIEFVSHGHPDYIVYKEGADISYLDSIDVIKIMYQRKDMDYLHQLKEELDWASHSISLSFSSNRYLEMNPLGINKGNGIKELSQYLGIDIENTLGIGDNFNDLELIQDAGIGCVVQNAIQPCKDIADYIAINDNNHDAIKEIIDKYIFD